jgi:hypothetical protein
MRVGFNGFGQLGIFAARGLGAPGDCVAYNDDGTCAAYEPTVSVDNGTPVTVPMPGSTLPPGDNGPAFNPVPTTDASGAVFSTPSDGVYLENCSAYDANGNCVGCGSGYKLNTWGGAYTGCDSVGGLPGAKKPANQPSAFSSILNSIFGTGATRPQSAVPTTSAACTAAGGTWTGTACTPKGSLNIGGMAISTTTLLIGGVILFLVAKRR